MWRCVKHIALYFTSRREYIQHNGRCLNGLSHHTIENCASLRNCFNSKEHHNSTSCPNSNVVRTKNKYKFEKTDIHSSATGNNNAHSSITLVTTPAANSSETYLLTLPTNEKVTSSLCGLSTDIRRKHVRLGIVAVQIRNPITNQSTNVYAFQDSRMQRC